MNTLQQHELEEIDQLDLQNEETKERFKIDDAEKLNWAMRKLSTLNRKKNEIDELTAKEIERITSWRNKEFDSINHSIVFFESLIIQYAMSERSKDPNFKKVSSPYGKVIFEKKQPKWIYDEKKLVVFLKNNGYDFVRVKEEPEKDEIKKHFKVDDDGRVFCMYGQEVEGVTVEFQDDKLSIKVVE